MRDSDTESWKSAGGTERTLCQRVEVGEVWCCGFWEADEKGTRLGSGWTNLKRWKRQGRVEVKRRKEGCTKWWQGQQERKLGCGRCGLGHRVVIHNKGPHLPTG